jgi:hypothetical protein
MRENEKLRKQKASWQTILAALEHFEERGRLHGFGTSRQEKLTVMKAVIEQGLVAWHKAVGKYELTTLGQKRLSLYRARSGAVEN